MKFRDWVLLVIAKQDGKVNHKLFTSLTEIKHALKVEMPDRKKLILKFVDSINELLIRYEDGKKIKGNFSANDIDEFRDLD